jgi:hypothetical protein
MTIKNISQKVINIGTTILMPDKAMEATKAVTETPAIKAMAERGYLVITGGNGDKGEKPTEEKGDTGDIGDTGNTEEDTEDTGDKQNDGVEKKPLSRMTKAELVEECQRLGIEVDPEDTNPMMVEKIKAATAK